jgi:predicted GIY-YIG superfamily endonuclease
MGRPSKLTDRQWSEIEGLILNGESSRKIAGKYDVTEGAIRRRLKNCSLVLLSKQHRIARSDIKDRIASCDTGIYVYIISAKEFLGLYKIGITDNIQRRIDDLQTGCPYDLFALKVYQVRNNAFIERMLHAFFHKKRVRGEWFRLESRDLEYIDDAMDSFNEVVRE